MAKTENRRGQTAESLRLQRTCIVSKRHIKCWQPVPSNADCPSHRWLRCEPVQVRDRRSGSGPGDYKTLHKRLNRAFVIGVIDRAHRNRTGRAMEMEMKLEMCETEDARARRCRNVKVKRQADPPGASMAVCAFGEARDSREARLRGRVPAPKFDARLRTLALQASPRPDQVGPRLCRHLKHLRHLGLEEPSDPPVGCWDWR